MNYLSSKNGAGFTLVEIVLVTAMIGVLSTTIIAIVNPLEQFQKGRDAQRKSDLAQIQRALEIYYQDYNKYPDDGTSNNNLDYHIDNIEWGSSFAPYMQRLPADPYPFRRYVYISEDPHQSYKLYASLERGEKDPSACNPDGNSQTNDSCANAPPSPGQGDCGAKGFLSQSHVCSYGVTSPNASP